MILLVIQRQKEVTIKNLNRIILLQPLGKLDQTDGFMRTCNLEPLALEYLQSSLELIGIESSLYYGKIDEELLFNDLSISKPLAVCFSVYTYQYSYCLQLAKRIKNIFCEDEFSPYIIFGGYHSSAMPKEIVEENDIDFVVVGEGEVTLNELIIAIKEKSDISSVKGLWYKNPDHYFTGTRDRIKDFDSLPSPKRHAEILASTNQYQITYPAPLKQKNVAQVTYSRGCPYSCSFCSAENMWGKGINSVVWRSPSKVLDEIEMLYYQYGTNLIYFPDLTFNVNTRKVEEICNEFIKRNLPVYWWGLFRLDKLNNDILHILKESKCIKMSIGFEAADIDAIKVKGDYIVQQDIYAKLLHTANDLGLILKAFLIIGFPDDTEDKIKHRKDFMLSIPIDEIRITFITPFPGTAIWNEYNQKKILPNSVNFDYFTTENPIINHKYLSSTQLINLRTEITQSFYMDDRYIEHVVDKISKHARLKDSFIEYFLFLEEKGILPKEILSNKILYLV